MPRSNKRSRAKGLPPRLQLQNRENAGSSTNTFWDDRSAITFATYPSSSNTWKDDLWLYFKMNSDNSLSERIGNPGTKSFEQNFKVEYFSPSFLPRCLSVQAEEALVSGSVFLYQQFTQITTSIQRNQYPDYAYTKDDLGLNFNSFGKLDRTPRFFWNNHEDNDNFNIQFINTEDQIDLSRTDLSFTVWVKPEEAFGDGEGYIIYRTDEFNIQMGSVEAGGTSPYVAFVVIDSDAGGSISIIKYLPRFSSTQNDWMHIAAVYHSGSSPSLDLYINGETDFATQNLSFGTFVEIANITEPIWFGRNPDSETNRWGGYLNEVAIFGKALSAEEVRKIYNCRSSLVLDEQGGVVYPIGLNTQNQWINSTEFTSSMIVPNARATVNVADGFVSFFEEKETLPFSDGNQYASDGKSNGLDFFATGSSINDAGEGFLEPLWSKTVLEFDYEVLHTSSVGYRSASNGNSEGNDYAMMYWNPDAQAFWGVGSNRSWDYYQNLYDTTVGGIGNTMASQYAARVYLSDKAVGFLPFVPNIANSQYATYYSQAPISEFGFPFDDKYHIPYNSFGSKYAPGSSSILIPLTDKIKQPFVLEKVVVEFSCSHFSRDYWAQGTGGSHGEAINTFFILNQRKMKNYFSGTIAPTIDLASGTSVKTEYLVSFAATTSSLDLVSFNQFAFLAAPTASIDTDSSWIAVKSALKSRNIPYFLCGQDNDWERIRFDYTGSIVISGSANLCYPTQDIQRTIQTIAPGDSIKMTLPGPVIAGAHNEIQNPGSYGGRSGVGQYGSADSRNLLRNVVGIERYNTTDVLTGTEKVYPKLQQATPYVLQPTDNLIFGFQGAYIGKSEYTDAFPFTSSSVNRGPTLSILPGKFKVRLYGSYVVEGKEYHETLDQILTSNTIRKVIE